MEVALLSRKDCLNLPQARQFAQDLHHFHRGRTGWSGNSWWTFTNFWISQTLQLPKSWPWILAQPIRHNPRAALLLLCKSVYDIWVRFNDLSIFEWVLYGRQVEHEVTSAYQQEGQLVAYEAVAFAISRKIHRQDLLSSICRVVSSHANKHGLVEGASAHHFREARRCAPTQTTTELVRRQSASCQNCISWCILIHMM